MRPNAIRALLLVLLLVAPPAARASRAEPVMLPDSTYAERWTLPNGLEVATRRVPGAADVSVSWGYAHGLDDDPAGEPGLASLLAEVAFTAATAGAPERTREEMESLRPHGWSLKVTRRQTLFSETAKPGQLAGVLRQIADRMHGVQVTRPVLDQARSTVRRMMGQRYFGAVDQMLASQVREYARGLDKAGIVALASAQGLDRETPASIQAALTRVYAPANGVLVLAGDFGDVDLHAVVSTEFGALPAGARPPASPSASLDSVTRVIQRPEITTPIGVLGLRAPALTDTLHPTFYLTMLILGGQAKQGWGRPDPPLTTRFQYAMLDDPDFVRFYPALGAHPAADPAVLSNAFDELWNGFFDMLILRDAYLEYSSSVLWLLGGPLQEPVRDAVTRDPAALNLLCTSTASRALWGSDEFWADYRRRFAPERFRDVRYWKDWLADPRNRARLLAVPQR
ncbi:MAG TPA: hypothetical protein VMS88_06580 [Terriglobales bacterium]|nr:hypothetical protein [Terriglobales bacterium]